MSAASVADPRTSLAEVHVDVLARDLGHLESRRRCWLGGGVDALFGVMAGGLIGPAGQVSTPVEGLVVWSGAFMVLLCRSVVSG